MTAAVIGGAVAQWPIGHLSDKLGRRKVMAAMGIAGAVLGLFLFVSGMTSFVGLIAFSAAWGFVAFPIYSIAVAHANDNADPEDYVMVSAGLLLMYGAGAIAGPFLASMLMTLIGVSALYAYTGTIHLLLMLYVIARMVRRASRPEEHHIPFTDAMATAHTASHVYEEEIQHQAEDEAA